MFAVCAGLWLAAPGCAVMRTQSGNRDLRPCDEGFAPTDDGWLLGARRYRPAAPDPDKLPVILCHGLGLNGTFWTITDNHLPSMLCERGYEVFVFDMRGSGASHRLGAIGSFNHQVLRQTPIPEIGNRKWTMDDQTWHDVPAMLAYVERETGSRRVNWVGHSLGGMLMYPYLEMSPERDRIANFVGMGCSATLVNTPQTKMLRASYGLRNLMFVLSTSRIARPMTYGRIPGLGAIDQLYYTEANVDKRTVDRFYGYTLEDPGAGALKQLAAYLRFGHLVSADGGTDYAERLPEIKAPTLLIAGEGDIMDDMPSMERTFALIGSRDKTMLRFGKREGHLDDYGHCDLVWSRNAPFELFPPLIDWLDSRQARRSGTPQAEADETLDRPTQRTSRREAAVRPRRTQVERD